MNEYISQFGSNNLSDSSGFNYLGYIHFICGPMFSGKTSELIKLKKRVELSGMSYVVIKYFKDNRFDEINKTNDLKEMNEPSICESKLYTHDKHYVNCIQSDDNCLSKTIIKYKDIINDSKYIFIDEVQFYDDIGEVSDFLANKGHVVYVFGLQGDSNRRMFESIADLFPRCEMITHLTAIDRNNGKDASFTKRKINSSEQIIIGADDIYEAVSREYFFKNKN